MPKTIVPFMPGGHDLRTLVILESSMTYCDADGLRSATTDHRTGITTTTRCTCLPEPCDSDLHDECVVIGNNPDCQMHHQLHDADTVSA